MRHARYDEDERWGRLRRPRHHAARSPVPAPSPSHEQRSRSIHGDGQSESFFEHGTVAPSANSPTRLLKLPMGNTLELLSSRRRA